MIGVCQEGKSSLDALREERGYNSFSEFLSRVLASQPRFLFDLEPDFHLLSWPTSGLTED